MEAHFLKILEIARENVRKNPSIVKVPTAEICERYLEGLMDEVAEVRAEIREHNEVHLTDELSDIAWDYAVVLALAEYRGLIENAELVLAHGAEKYGERAPAFLESSEDMWDAVKAKQKADLKARHQEKYGS